MSGNDAAATPWESILRSASGAVISTADEWSRHRQTLLNLFDEYLYGPELTIESAAVVDAMRMVGRGLSAAPAPCIIVLVPSASPAVSPLTDDVWGTADILERGWIQASIAPADVVSDDVAGIAAAGGGLPGGPGVLSAWASIVSAAIDTMTLDPAIDPRRIAIVGQSRLGKAALLAGARDSRISAVIASQSGLGGAAPLRDVVENRPGAREAAEAAVRRFPHWFTPAFADCAATPEECPVDAHQLIALCAPRFVMLPNARDDHWVDPLGQQVAASAAAPAWELLDARSRAPIWSVRDGIHGIEAAEWRGWLDQLESRWAL